ncbi:nuclear pore complex protein Nup88-like [Argonauta hians]
MSTCVDGSQVGWRSALNNLPFVEKLQQQTSDIGDRGSNPGSPTISKGLIAVRDGSLYIWDSNNGHLLHVNLLHLASSNTTNTTTTTGYNNSNTTTTGYNNSNTTTTGYNNSSTTTTGGYNNSSNNTTTAVTTGSTGGSSINNNAGKISNHKGSKSIDTVSPIDDQSPNNQFQVLVPSPVVPVSSVVVEQVVFNRTGQYVAVWGQVGIWVLTLPHRLGRHGMYSGGGGGGAGGGGDQHTITVRTFPVAERLLVSHTDVRLLQVSWHPGSYYDGHLVFLALDNVLRICDVNEPDKIFQEIHLVSPGTPLVPCSLYTVAIGDSAVSFDFGAALDVPYSAQPVRQRKSRTVWPIYVLRGSGDVLVVYSDITSKVSPFSLLSGPLLVHPPAEDNYGTDACSILCLRTTPPVVVIATNEGKLHHCIVLTEKTAKSAVPLSSTLDPQSPHTTSTSSSVLIDPSSLYVYESVELELSLHAGRGSQCRSHVPVEDVFTCPIHLVKDVNCEERYHCFHAAGVHTVSLPWIKHYEEFCNNANEDSVPNVPQSERCLVEHVLCTKPLASSPQFPVLGLGTTTNHLLGKTIIILTSDCQFLTIPLNDRYQLPPLTTGCSQNSPDTFGSPLKEFSKEPFDHQLAKMLQRTASAPLLKSGKGADISQEECYLLLIRSTKVFREQYIQKQDLAIEQIKRRLNILLSLKTCQMSELCEMLKKQESLRDFSESLAEKYDSSKDRQDSLLKRVSVLVRKVQSYLPIVSDAERDMMKELKTMEQQLDSLRTQFNKVKKMKEYQEHQVSLSPTTAPLTSPNTIISCQNLVHIKDILAEQTGEINNLMKSVKDLKLETLT